MPRNVLSYCYVRYFFQYYQLHNIKLEFEHYLMVIKMALSVENNENFVVIQSIIGLQFTNQILSDITRQDSNAHCNYTKYAASLLI